VDIESHLMRNYAMSSMAAKAFVEGRGKNIARCRSTIDKVNSKQEGSNKSKLGWLHRISYLVSNRTLGEKGLSVLSQTKNSSIVIKLCFHFIVKGLKT
jgi:hypothetical protein